MTNTPTKKKLSEYTFEDLKIFFLDLTRKISSKVILLEISNSFFNIALAKSQNDRLQIKKVFRQNLPLEAIEKSIPSDIDAFSNVLEETIKEQKLFSQRVAIVLASDACYTRLIDIPSRIKEEEVRNFLRNPNSGIQIPISLNNSDFDIQKTNLPKIYKDNIAHNRYFLTSIPKKNVNTILEIIKKANLELSSIQVSHMCVGNLFKGEIEKLDSNQLIISIDLLDEFTQLIIFDKNGPIFIKRIGAIRKYPTIEEMKLINNKENKENNSSIDYHLLSTLDLKVLIREIRDSFNKFLDINNLNKKGKIFLTGRNSQHKNLVTLLGQSLEMDVALISPLGNHKLSEFSYDPNLINQFSMTRIVGLGLSLMNDNLDYDKYQNLNELLIEVYKSKKNNNNYENKKQNQNIEIKSEKRAKEIKKESNKKNELPPLPNIEIKSEKKAKEIKKESNKKNELPPLPNIEIKSEKKGKEIKKESNKKDELPPLPNIKIQRKTDSVEKIINRDKENKNIKDRKDLKNKEDKEFKMDTSFLDID